jgi:alanine-glyoxylate transaminase/serine-glyoxylate transaminase/serine-pyruvate transaminase
MDPYYLRIMDELQSMLRDVFRTKNRMTMAISGTGSAGQEATVLNLVEPGERVLVCINGVFGGRLADMAERAGGEVTKIERPWGEVFSLADVKEALARVKPRVVAIVLAETSTGAWQPIEEIAAAVRDSGAMLILDTVTALGGIPVEIDTWQVDAVYSGTQKCLSCPPGLAPVSFSDRAVEKILQRREKVRSWYLDVSLIANYWGGDRVYHHTAPINMTYALHEALRLVLEEGLEASFARHRLNHAALKAGLSAIGIEYATQAGHALPQLNAVRIPAGVDDAAVRKALLERFGIEIGAGLGAFKGKVWRIGLMGYASREGNVITLLAAFEQLLGEQGYQFDRGAALAAANSIYAGNGGLR